MDRTRPDPPSRSKQEPALKRLNPWIGMWNLELAVPSGPPATLRGSWSTFEWMDGGMFMIWCWGPTRVDFPGGLFPSGHSIIGYDDSEERYFMHYFDSRGVYRVFDLTVADRVWEISRSSPSFSQRFKGRLGDDGNTFTGAWERSGDGTRWDHDFDMIFTRAT
jgi:hypothetical protein